MKYRSLGAPSLKRLVSPNPTLKSSAYASLQESNTKAPSPLHITLQKATVEKPSTILVKQYETQTETCLAGSCAPLRPLLLRR